jgi:hypothetical protein
MSMKKLVAIVLIIASCALVALGGRYYSYATRGENPYDEIGIALAQWMPGRVRPWGCGKLKERFGKVLPPYGCQQYWAAG